MAVQHSKAYGDYVTFRGAKMPEIDRTIALALPTSLSFSQGGLSGAVKASAKTHFGLGCFDVRIGGWTKEQTWLFASEGLRSGWVVFPRGFTWDTFQGRTLGNIHDGNEHCHVCSRESYKQLHPQAQAQIDEYLKSGGDGLIGSAGYTGPATKSDRWTNSPYNLKNIKDVQGTAVVQVNTLIGNSVDRFKRESKDVGDEINFVKMVKRWGRWNIVTSKDRYFAVEDADGLYVKVVEKEETPIPVPTPTPEVPTPVETYTQN